MVHLAAELLHLAFGVDLLDLTQPLGQTVLQAPHSPAGTAGPGRLRLDQRDSAGGRAGPARS